MNKSISTIRGGGGATLLVIKVELGVEDLH